MINLLPPEAKKNVVKEYWLTVAYVLFLMLTFVALFLAAAQIPTYVLLTSQLSGYEIQFEAAQSEQTQLKKAEEEVKTINNLARHLTADNKEVFLSSYVVALEDLAKGGIDLKTFSATRGKDNLVDKIEISGVASSRTTLSSFSERIINDPLFAEANVPIENLAKESDISFNITVVPAKPE